MISSGDFIKLVQLISDGMIVISSVNCHWITMIIIYDSWESM